MRVLFNRCIVLFVFYFFIFFQIKSQELFFKSEIGNSVNVSQIIVANSIRKDTFNKQYFSSFNISSFVNCDTISIVINDTIISRSLKEIIANNYEFIVWSNKGQESKRKSEGLDYFFSIDSFERNTKINKDGNYSIDINLKQVFDYLVERKLVKNTDIVPGIEVTTEIWDGIGEMKIKKLKYEIVKE